MAMVVPFLAAMGGGAGAGAGAAAAAGASAAAGAGAAAAGSGAAAAAGMSAATKAALWGMAASGVIGGVQAKQAGVAADRATRIEANQERDAARGREIDRRRALLAALASQNAAAGAGGVAFSGGLAAAARRDVADARRDSLTDTVNTDARVRALRSQGRSARMIGNLGAAKSLLDTGVQGYQSFGG